MAAITVSTDTFLDGGTARVAGDTYNVNGCTFTIRTDSRVHANAPASMTGALNNMIVSSALGGTIKVDGSKVRWMAYTSGTGNVPAIGTSVTQGGVSGYLLGVWADYLSAPTAVGASMPTTGYLKLREVTGGQYATGALTGIGASAAATNGSGAGADAPGWIEVAMDSGTSFQSQELGGGVVVTGGWFYLDNTTGTRGQQINVPTNGGGTGTHVFAVQIETAAGSGVYEWFPTAAVAAGASVWSTANFATDARAKFVETMGNGVIRIGSDGTSNIGYLPPTGCKVRIPNVFGRTVATASRATNQVPGAVTRAGMSNGNFTIDGLHCDFTLAATNAPHISLKRFVSEVPTTLNNTRDPLVIDTACFGGYTGGASLTLTLSNITSGTVSNLKVVNSGYILGALNPTFCSNITFSDVEVIIFKARTATSFAITLSSSNNCTFLRTKAKGATLVNMTTCTNCTFTNSDFVDRLEGNTTAVSPNNIFQWAQSANITVDTVTWGEFGTLANCNPYNSIVTSATNPSNNIRVRNIGSRTAPLDSGSNATFYPATIFNLYPGDTNVKYQRCYVSNVRTAPWGTAGISALKLLVEDVYTTTSFTTAPQFFGQAAIYRKIGAALQVGVSMGGNAGTHWADYFTSDTAGVIRWFGEAPTTATSANNYLSITASQGSGYIGSSGVISLDTPGDAAYSECDWSFLGHTSFQNVSPVFLNINSNVSYFSIVTGNAYTISVVGSANFTLWGAAANTVGTSFIATTTTSTGSGSVLSYSAFYQLDTGSGYSGTWKGVCGATLSAETISPAGFKMKLKFMQGAAEPTLGLQALTLLTNSTKANQAANLYPLDTVTLSFEGLQPGSEVRAYTGTDPATAVEIGGIESVVGTTFSFTHSSAGVDGYIVVFALGFEPVRIARTYASVDSTLLISQVIDRNYLNP